MKKAIVIGSGFGGLAIASRLKYRGYDVKLLEKQADLGGRARALSSNGFVYDAGPTVITAPYLINELFELHDEASSDYFELMKVKPFYRFLFSDKTFFDYGDSLYSMIRNIAKQYSKDDAKGYIKLLKHSKRIFNTAYLELSDKPFENFGSMLPYMRELMNIKFYKSVDSSVRDYVGNDNLAKALSMHPLLIGGNPYATTSIYLLIQYLEWKWGVYYAKGGTRSIISGLFNLMNKIGVECLTNQEVINIESKNNQIKRVICLLYTSPSPRDS